MIIKCYEPNIEYKYISSFDNENYIIKVRRIIDGFGSIVLCDYYNTDGAGQELLSLGDLEQREVIQANDIEDCPTLKGFYIVRPKIGN